MRSRYAEEFNHDDSAPGYDQDVADESNPIRTGYRALLDWVAETAAVGPEHALYDLGCGTGNLSQRLLGCGRLVGVDVSKRMLEIAAGKLASHADVTLVEDDLLGFLEDAPPVDVVVSTYAIHHLPEDEKLLLFERVRAVVGPGGRAVFGDLMFADEAAERAAIERFRAAGKGDVAGAIEEEFFWRVDSATRAMESHGFDVESKQFSDLSWGIVARR